MSSDQRIASLHIALLTYESSGKYQQKYQQETVQARMCDE